jgi:hypothetical protein
MWQVESYRRFSKRTRTNPWLCWGNTTILISGKEWKKLKLIIKKGVDCIPVPEKCPRIERFVKQHMVEALFLKMRGWREWLGRFGKGKLKEESIFLGFCEEMRYQMMKFPRLNNRYGQKEGVVC